MSAPLRRFGNLTIDTTMPTTRGQAYRSAQASPGAGSSSSSEDQASDNDGPGTLPVQPPSAAVSALQNISRTGEEIPFPSMYSAFRIRDILSTFSKEDEFPSEFRQDIWDKIQLPRTPADCVRQGDLEGTIFQLAAINKAVYESLNQAQPPHICQTHFKEKLDRELKKTLDTFDSLGPRSGTKAQVLAAVKRCAANLRRLEQAGVQDQRDRQTNAQDLAGWLLNLLKEVCERHNPTSAGPSGRLVMGSDLFQILIGQTSGSESMFVLDALDALPRDAVIQHSARVSEISQVLDSAGAVSFKQRLDNYLAEQPENIYPVAGNIHPGPEAIETPSQTVQPSRGEAISPAEASTARAGRKRPAGGPGRAGRKRTR